MKLNARNTGLGLALIGVSGLGACGGGGGGGGGAPNTLGGTVVACGTMPVVGVDVLVFDQNGNPLSQFDTVTNGVGRWEVTGLGAGTYQIEFRPPPVGTAGLAAELPPIHYQGVVVANGTNAFQPVSLPPIIAGTLVTQNAAADQTGLTFLDDGGSEPLPGLSAAVLAGTEIRFGGVPVDDPSSGFTDADPVAPGFQFELQLGLVPPEQVPMPFIDENGDGRTNQLFFTLQPAGTTFHVAGSVPLMSALVALTYPNLNGLADQTTVDLFYFDHDQFDWLSAGTATVMGSLVVPDPGAGVPAAGWNAAPGPPPPTTEVIGCVTQGGNPFPHANQIVVTNNGFFGLTDASGCFSIPNVPIIGGNTALFCRVYTDLSLAFEVASSPPVMPSFPQTTCDIDIAGSPLDSTAPTVTGKEPANLATGVPIDAAIKVFFSERINELTLDAASFTVTETGVGAVTGSILFQTTSAPETTTAIFVPQNTLTRDANHDVVIANTVEDLNGNTLASAHAFSFRTGTTGSATSEVFAMSPQKGVAGTAVTVTGVGLGTLAVMFDGTAITPTTQTASTIEFDVPALTGVGAGIKVVDFGGVKQRDFCLLPSITSLTPPSGTPGTIAAPSSGTLVTIDGFNFDPAGANDSIVFSAAPATAEAGATSEQIMARVPPGASSGVVIVSTNGLASPGVFFTVMAPVDSTAPSLVDCMPPDGATDVSVATSIVLTFDELIALDSVPSVVDSTGGGTAITGTTTVTSDSTGTMGILEFVPSTQLPAMSDIVVTEGSITDLAGNPAMPFTKMFTTGLPVGCGPLIAQAKLDLENGNLQAAKLALELCLADPTATTAQQNESSFYLALIDLALEFDMEGDSAGAMNLHSLLAVFGFPAGGPDLFNLGLFTAPMPLPTNSPDCSDVLTHLTTYKIPAFQTARDRLATLPASFTSTFTDSMTSTTTEIDYTDVLAARSAIDAQLFWGYFVGAYGCDLDIDCLINDMDGCLDNYELYHLLDADATFLSLDPIFGNARLINARQALRNAIDGYNLGLNSLEGEADPQGDDLIVFDPSDPVASEQEAEDVRSFLNEVLAATNGSHGFALDNGATLSVNLNTPFTTLDIRDQLPTLVKGSNYQGLAPLPDPDLNGILATNTAQTNDCLDLLLAFTPLPASITVNGTTSDWPASARVFTDPSGTSDLCADLQNVSGQALDITSIYMADDGSNYYLRIDFQSGIPDPSLHDYYFTITPTTERDTELSFEGFLYRASPGVYELQIYELNFFTPVIDNTTSQVAVGTQTIELSFEKAPFDDTTGLPLGIDESTEYAFEVFTEGQNPTTFEEGFDDAAPFTFHFDLP